MTLWLIRHAATQGNLKRQYIGHTDEPLCKEGLEQAANAAGQFGSPARVFVSPLQRCLETAKILFPESKFEIVNGLRETDFGAYEGKTYEELKEEPAYQTFCENGGETAFPGGESRADVSVRACAAFEKIVLELHAQKVQSAALVLHGGTMMAILERFGVPQKSYYDYHTGNCGGFLVRAELRGEAPELICLEKREGERA